ncbi:MAG: DNA repair protein RecN, partial [Clostridiales bacterium]|nr:DNA repair protein RecN [Clostridiales bacterium]
QIENIAVIESASLDLSHGFNVLTGETGAGKSIIIDSINAVLGERTSRDLIRTGADKAKVSALFTDFSDDVRDAVIDCGADCDGEILITRVITADGRNTCRVNGSPVTVSMLRSLGRRLVNIHGQHDSQALLDPESHVTFIDRLADNGELLCEFKKEYDELLRLKREKKEYILDDAEKERRLDVLSFQVDELTKADIRIGERDELAEKKALFRNSEKIIRYLNEAYELLEGSDETAGAASDAENAADCLDEVSEYVDPLKDAAEKIREYAYGMKEYASEIRDSLSSLDIDPIEAEETEERLDLLYRLSRKYGATEEDMLSFLRNAEDEIKKIKLSEKRINDIESKINIITASLERTAAVITKRRTDTAKKFADSVCEELSFLNMPNVVFKVDINPCAMTENGCDSVEFLISANVGEEPKPLAKIASGGELSRIMLAIKNVLSDRDDTGTLIFDEIDTGVSGRAAQKVALKLYEVSKKHQVICVTHLSQIACMADEHLLIEKSARDGKTYTGITHLTFEGRKAEIARINSGADITFLQLQNAEEMLQSASEIKGRLIQ